MGELVLGPAIANSLSMQAQVTAVSPGLLRKLGVKKSTDILPSQRRTMVSSRGMQGKSRDDYPVSTSGDGRITRKKRSLGEDDGLLPVEAKLRRILGELYGGLGYE